MKKSSHDCTSELQYVWIEKLEKTYPWFPDSVECGNGWRHLIVQLCQDIQAVLDARPLLCAGFKISLIKAKYARLTVYADPEIGEIERLLADAAERSAHICEECGAPGITGSIPHPHLGRWDCVRCRQCQGGDFIPASALD